VSFDYDKISDKGHEHASWWTSYADLFMMLSIVFLLMFVASSLRNGSVGFQQQVEYKKLEQKSADLEEQIKVYNTLKDESLKTESSQAEQQVYQKLMDKLTLLKEDARDEKLALEKKAKENEEKEFALNQYQQLVRNIINTNILAKSQIIHRDQVIVSKDATIEEKKQKIAEMELVVSQNEKQINTINSQLDQQIKALQVEQHNHKISKILFEKKIAHLRQDSENKVAVLEQKNAGITEQLGEVRSTLAQTSEQLTTANVTIGKQEQTIGQQAQEKAALVSQLEQDRSKYTNELQNLRAKHEQQLADERAAFDANLKKQRLTAAAKSKKLAEFTKAADAKAAMLESQLGGLQGKIADTENKLNGAEQALAGTQQKLAGTQEKLAGTEQALQGTQQKLNGTQQALAGTQEKLSGTQQALAGTQEKLAGTQQALMGTQEKLAGAEDEKGRALAAVADLKDDLAKTRAIANARKQLASELASQFAKSGLKGAVDGRTGEVTLDFGEEYFDTGSTVLKPKMRVVLDKFIPLYAKSLFADPKIASKIANVEIIGLASSTYKGRYVNPKSVQPGDKEALEYNLKLSFGRANSIFTHVLNQNELSQLDRDRLLPLMKVVGRGYLPEGSSASDLPDNMSEQEFCQKYNCKKAQRVVVKFNMKD
jgi:hypothetical protein